MSYSDMKRQFRQWLKNAQPTKRSLGGPIFKNQTLNFQPAVTTSGFPIYDPDLIPDPVDDPSVDKDRALNQDLIQIFTYLHDHYTTNELIDGIHHIQALQVLYQSKYAQLVIPTVIQYVINLALRSMRPEIKKIGDQINQTHPKNLADDVKTLADHRLKDLVKPLKNRFAPEFQTTFDQHVQAILDQYDFDTWYQKIATYQFGQYLQFQLDQTSNVTNPFEQAVVKLPTIDSVVNLWYLANHVVNQINTQTFPDAKNDDAYTIDDTTHIQVSFGIEIDHQFQNLINQAQLKHPNLVFKNPFVDLGIELDQQTFEKLLDQPAPMIEYHHVLIDYNQLQNYQNRIGIDYSGCVIYGHDVETGHYDHYLRRIDHLYQCYQGQAIYNLEHPNTDWSDNIDEVKQPYVRLRTQSIIDRPTKEESHDAS